jgi:hypothetical protein
VPQITENPNYMDNDNRNTFFLLSDFTARMGEYHRTIRKDTQRELLKDCTEMPEGHVCTLPELCTEHVNERDYTSSEGTKGNSRHRNSNY